MISSWLREMILTYYSFFQLHLARGRRYGLVGRNGTGKTTLMRAISGREINLPRGVRVLHVEQEVKKFLLYLFVCLSFFFFFFLLGAWR